MSEKYQNISFDAIHADFNNLSISQNFDMVWCIHSLYYFSELESTLFKMLSLLKADGKIAIASEPLQALGIPFLYFLGFLQKSLPNHSEDVVAALERLKCRYKKQAIAASLNVSSCFNSHSQEGKQLLDFILGFNTSYFSNSQKQIFLDYLHKISCTNLDEEKNCPYNSNLFWI